MINKYSNTPMYSQLKSIILKKIENGDYPEGAKIPSEEELCESYGISRPTVRQAINELNSSGFLYREKGKGTYVSKKGSYIGIKKFTGFHNSILADNNQNSREISREISRDNTKENAKENARKIIGINKITPQSRPILSDLFKGILQDSPFACSEFLLHDEENPFARVWSYIPLSIFPDIIEGLIEKKPMVDLLKGKYPFLPHFAKSTLEVITASAEDSDFLQVQPGQALIKITSIIYSKGGQAVEVVVSLYKADSCKLFFENTIH